VFFEGLGGDEKAREWRERKTMNFMSLRSFLKYDLKFMKYKK